MSGVLGIISSVVVTIGLIVNESVIVVFKGLVDEWIEVVFVRWWREIGVCRLRGFGRLVLMRGHIIRWVIAIDQHFIKSIMRFRYVFILSSVILTCVIAFVVVGDTFAHI